MLTLMESFAIRFLSSLKIDLFETFDPIDSNPDTGQYIPNPSWEFISVLAILWNHLIEKPWFHYGLHVWFHFGKVRRELV